MGKLKAYSPGFFMSFLLGLFLILYGLNLLNDPNCASVSFTMQGRGGGITCYPRDSSVSGWLPGDVYALLTIALGVLSILIGYDLVQNNKDKLAARSGGFLLAEGILGEVSGCAPARDKSSGLEGNLFWSHEAFVFIADDPVSSGDTKFSPIAFKEVYEPKFSQDYIGKEWLLRFEGPEVYMSFLSKSGKLKNLMKAIRKYKGDQ